MMTPKQKRRAKKLDLPVHHERGLNWRNIGVCVQKHIKNESEIYISDGTRGLTITFVEGRIFINPWINGKQRAQTYGAYDLHRGIDVEAELSRLNKIL